MGDRFIDRTHELAEEMRRVADPVAVDAGLMARLRSRIAGIETPAMRGDCLAILLASYFEDWADEDEETDENGTWKQIAVFQTEQVLNAIHAHYVTVLLSERQRGREEMRERAGAKVAEALAIVSHLHGPAVPIFTDILDAVANDIRSLSTED